MIEAWKEISGFERYLISSDGRVRSTIGKGRMLIPTPDTGGYLTVSLRRNNKTYKKTVHRLVAEQFMNNGDFTKQVNHIDGCKSNNSLTNLELLTCRDNIIHAAENGLRTNSHNRGSKCNTYKGPIVAEKLDKSIGYVMFGVVDLTENGFNSSSPYRCCAGQQKKHKGFTFNRIDGGNI